MATPKNIASKLNPRQRRFCEAYVRSMGKVTESAREAGYRCPREQGSRLLTNVAIKAYIDHLWHTMGMSEEEVLARLTDMARCDASQFVDAKGRVNMRQVKAKGHLVKKLKRDAKGRLELETYDAQAALVHVGKARGLFKESVSLEAPGGGPLVVQLAMDPAAITGTGAGTKEEKKL